MSKQRPEANQNRSESIELIKEYLTEHKERTLNEEQLTFLATAAINIGCLKIARGAQSILLSRPESKDKSDEICEKLSTMHNTRIGETRELVDQIWSRNIKSYENNELEDLVEALLIHNKSYLAQTICSARHNLSMQFIAEIEAGRVKFETSRFVDIDLSQSPTTITLKAFCSEHRSLPGDTSQNNKIITKIVDAITSEQVFFNAHLMPKQLLIPINAYDSEAKEYKYDHPSMDAPSLLWENNLPELDQWTEKIDKAGQALQSQRIDKRPFRNTWESWPSNCQYPKSIA